MASLGPGDHKTLPNTKYISCGPHVSEMKVCFLSIISLWELMTHPGHGQFGPQGLDWQDLCRGTTKLCYILNI